MDDPAIADPGRWSGEYNEVTLKLVALTETDPTVRTALKQSITAAREANGDSETNPVSGLSDYYRFVDRMSRLIPRDVLENPSDLVTDEILQSICYFYFLVDQEVEALESEEVAEASDEMYKPALQYYPPFSEWLREFSESWGAFLDTEESWNRKIYREFYADPRFGLQEDWYEPASEWSTFNEFFSRYLRDPSVRPIQQGHSIVTAPADSVPQGTWDIDEDSEITVGNDPASSEGIRIKNRTHYSVEDLLGEDSEYADAFAGGTFTHTFLNVNDYHRYHFPVAGEVIEKQEIEENVALEVGWDEDEGEYSPIDSTGWQFTQTRSYVIVDTADEGDFGLVGLVPMGMAEVSSVNFEDNLEVGDSFKKGDPLGYFLFGGSDFVMLFQDEANFEIEAPKKPQSDDGGSPYEHLHMGETYGVVDE
jgi:phosphatidylserine decarboxylase